MLSILHLSGGLHDLWDGIEIFRTSSFEEKYYDLKRPQPLWLDSNKKASGKAGAVQTIESIELNYYMQKTYSIKSGY